MKKIKLNRSTTLEITEKDGFTSLLVVVAEYQPEEGVCMPAYYKEVVKNEDAAKRIELLKEIHKEYKRCSNCIFCIDNWGMDEEDYPDSTLPKCFKLMYETEDCDVIFCKNCISERDYK